MKRLIVIIFALLCGVTFSNCFAKKPKRTKMTNEERQAKLDSLRRKLEKYDEERKPKIVFFDTIRIDSLIEVPIYVDYHHHLMLPMILCYNPVDYIQYAFGDTDKNKYYCAIGRGEAEKYKEARHLALIDAVTKIHNVAGNNIKLGSAELLMEEEDKIREEYLEHIKEELKIEGDTSALAFIQENENKHKVEVAIRILKNK